ncbi:MAG: DUF2577 family protein [Aerococcus sp.]|nr:DUF2577 family protein [Aerococcus sp.]
MGGERLAKIIKDITPKADAIPDLVYGEVTSTSPLTIRVDNRFEIKGQPFIELSQFVKDFSITVETEKGKQTIPIFRSLKAGDHVRMLRVQNGQKFYVVERM